MGSIIQSKAIVKEEVIENEEGSNNSNLFPDLRFERRPSKLVTEDSKSPICKTSRACSLYRSSDEEYIPSDQTSSPISPSTSYSKSAKILTQNPEANKPNLDKSQIQKLLHAEVDSDKNSEDEFESQIQRKTKRIVKVIPENTFQQEHTLTFFESSGYDTSDNNRYWGRNNLVCRTAQAFKERAIYENSTCDANASVNLGFTSQ